MEQKNRHGTAPVRSVTELYGLNVCVYDVEIFNCIGDEVEVVDLNGTGETRKELGWGDLDKLGFSVACLFDYRDGDAKVYFDKDKGQLAERLNEADLVVGFNIVRFDNELLRKQGCHLRKDVVCYDMLLETRQAIGGGFVKGCKLDNHLLGTFGPHLLKTGHGEEAPRRAQAGDWAWVTTYCLGDVRRERLLFEHAWRFGTMATDVHGEKLVRHPSLLLPRKEKTNDHAPTPPAV